MEVNNGLTRVLLINPPIETQMEGVIIASVCEPLGLLYIASVLEQHGVEVEVIDGVAEGLRHEDLQCRMIESGPDVVGIGCMMTETFSDAMETANTAKSAVPEAKVVIGGHYASFVADKIIETFPDVDYVVVGEGEYTFFDLVRSIENKHDAGEIKGIAFRHDGKAVFTGARKPIQNLDIIPFPAKHLVANACYGNLSLGGSSYYISLKNFSGMITSRGCPFRCIFCSCTAFSGNTVRYRSPENVVSEIEHLVNDDGIEQIFIADDNFLMFPRRVMEICRLIKERKIDVDWLCEGRVDTASEKMYNSMADAGCRIIFFGIESGSQRVLDYYRKKTTVEKGEQAIAMAQRAGIDVIGSMMVGAPVETEEDFQKTLDFIDRTDMDAINMNTLKVLPGTELWRQFEASGAIKPEDWNKYFEISNICDAHSKEKLDEWVKMANHRFFGRPKYLVKELWRTIKRRRDMIIPMLKNLL